MTMPGAVRRSRDREAAPADRPRKTPGLKLGRKFGQAVEVRHRDRPDEVLLVWIAGPSRSEPDKFTMVFLDEPKFFDIQRTERKG